MLPACMPAWHRIRNVQLCVFAADHPPPHFHAIAPDWDALIDIESLTVFQGKVPSAMLKEIKAWASLSHALLRKTWRTLNI